LPQFALLFSLAFVSTNDDKRATHKNHKAFCCVCVCVCNAWINQWLDIECQVNDERRIISFCAWLGSFIIIIIIIIIEAAAAAATQTFAKVSCLSIMFRVFVCV